MTAVLVLVTGPPAAGKTTLARPLADALELPLIGKDLIKEALFDALGTGDRAWSRRLGVASYEVLYAAAGALPAAVLDANLAPEAGPRLRALNACLVEVFCRCPADGVERRFAARAPTRHPGHVDHLIAPEMKAALVRGSSHCGWAVRYWKSTQTDRSTSPGSRPGSAPASPPRELPTSA